MVMYSRRPSSAGEVEAVLQCKREKICLSGPDSIFIFSDRNSKFGRKVDQIVSVKMQSPYLMTKFTSENFYILILTHGNATYPKAQSAQRKLNLNEPLTIFSSSIIEHAGHK